VKRTPLLILSLAAGLAGCFAPSPVVRLYPESPGVVWRDGRAIVSRQQPGYRTALAFDEADNRLAFRLEVQNTGAAPLEVDPAQMVYMSCIDPKSCYSPRSVVDPEQVLIGMDQAREREKASKANNEAVGAVFMLLDATVGVAAAVSGDHRTAREALHESGRVADETNRESAQYDAAISNLRTEREQWATVALRRTTLFPGQAVAGMIYLPLDTRASRIWVCARISGHDNWFPFRQEVISSEPREGPAPARAPESTGY
jgi:hypothetical protein